MKKILNIDIAQDKNGNNMKVCEFEGESKKVYVNSKYDSDIYEEVAVGKSYELEMDGNFLKIKRERPSGGSRAGFVQKTMQTKANNIKTAQEAKELSIKIASTFSQATAVALEEMKSDEITNSIEWTKNFQEKWKYWRSWLWNNYEATGDDITITPPF